MADKSRLKGNLSIRDIELMEMENDALKQSTPHVLYKQGPVNSMSRPCKLFIKVDAEGLLTDTISISDVVNFDSYESIVTSARRVISCFQSTKPGNIDVDALFFYKKRARSIRMNPVKIYNSTDGFRALAEHSSGEVPIGVHWDLKTGCNDSSGNDTGDLTLAQTTVTSLTKRQIPDDLLSIKSVNAQDNSALKKRRLEPKLPGSTSESPKPEYLKPGQFQPLENRPGPVFLLQQQLHVDKRTPPPAPSPQMAHIPIAPAPFKEVRSQTRHPYKSPYSWPENATMELNVTYDGFKEKCKLSPDIAHIMTDLLHGDYSCLSEVYRHSLQTNKMSRSSQEKLDEYTGHDSVHMNGHGIPTTNRKSEIKYLAEAKADIFQTLSMVNMSKARFKQLLAWMRTLRLEEGSQGKFYLSERNVVGGTRVTYNTDEEASSKLTYLHQNRPKPAVTLHPEPMQQVLQTLKVNPASLPDLKLTDPSQNQLFFLMPNQTSQPLVVNNSAILPSYAAPISQRLQHVVTPKGLVAHSAKDVSTMKEAGSVKPTEDKPPKSLLQAALSRVLNEVIRSPHIPDTEPTSGQLETNTDTSRSTIGSGHSSSTVPRILRSRRNNYHEVNAKDYTNSVGEIVPVRKNIIIEVTHGKARGKNSFDGTYENSLPFQIKEEPVDYESTASESTEDYNDRLSGSDLPGGIELYTDHAESSEAYNYSDVGILKADERLPQAGGELDRPFELVVKEEPIDTYEDDYR